ncbi:MAG: methyltransferase domain-containing protein [Bacteroidia bacterium]|jgi:ubiquinone/menaquinone biosynthesis C-methylase UbiE
MTWEEAIQDLRKKPENKQAILDNYFEENLYESADRFLHSEEFKALKKILPANAKTALDIGAGRGISSIALALQGIETTALEPDPSNDVGAGAIKKLAEHFHLKISVIESFGESLPFLNNSFDIVYVRQVLHHAHDLQQFCKEVARVLKPGGTFIATREHVLSNESDLAAFLKNHPLHHLYGGENAFTLAFYTNCIRKAGLKPIKILHPYASELNFAPLSLAEMKLNFTLRLSKFIGQSMATLLINVPAIFKLLTLLKANSDNTPGRLYSFISIKPGEEL